MNKTNTAEKINNYPTPTKLERTLQLSEAESNRNFTCFNYMNCLDTAIKNNWQSFTCRECCYWSEDKKPKKTKMFQELKCLLLLKAIFA